MNFNDIIKNSSKLMAMEKSGEISRKFGKNKKNNISEIDLTNQETINENINNQIETSQIKISQNSKLPKEIVESFRKSLQEEEEKNMEMMKVVTQNQTKPSLQIYEDKNNDFINNNFSSSDNLKDLIKETIREEISSLKILSLKDKINLITNDGDVYEVKLVFKKNINNK